MRVVKMLNAAVEFERLTELFALLGFYCAIIIPFDAFGGEKFIVGPKYNGPKYTITVGDFSVRAVEAPKEIGDGLREMLITALWIRLIF